MDNNTKMPFYEDMQINLNSLEGKNVSFSYGTFKRFENLILEHLDDGLPLDVKLAPCQCAKLDCTVCKAGWVIDKWIPFEPSNMFYCPPTMEGQGATRIYNIRESISPVTKDNAVDILKELGYTIQKGTSNWKSPKGKKNVNRTIIFDYLKKVFEYACEETVPNNKYILSVVDSLFEISESGKSPNELRKDAINND